MSDLLPDEQYSFAEYRSRVAPQPKTDTDDLSAAIKEFEELLPGWWWSVCVCSLTRDASCAPDAAGPDADLIESRTVEQTRRIFDNGFHCDDPEGTLASSLRNVMLQGFIAREAARGREIGADMTRRAKSAGIEVIEVEG